MFLWAYRFISKRHKPNGFSWSITPAVHWPAGIRISLDSVVYGFLDELSPEGIAESFDTLMLEEIYGALAFYVGHREEIDP